MRGSRFALLGCMCLLAACGGGPAKPSTTPLPVGPGPMNEGSGSATTTEPTNPAEPAKPAEPSAPDPAKVKAELLAAETAAFDKTKPVFDRWCAKCHSKTGAKTSASKREHFDMTTYPFGGHHAMELGKMIPEVLGATGKKPTMPADNKGAVKGEELELIKAWAAAFDASHAGGAHEGHGDHSGGHKH